MFNCDNKFDKVGKKRSDVYVSTLIPTVLYQFQDNNPP